MKNTRLSNQHQPPKADKLLLVAVLILAGLGLIMVLSSSGIMAERYFGDKYLFFKKQAAFFCIGAALMYACWRLPRVFFYELTYFWLVVAVILLALCSFTPLGVDANGAKRWISFGLFNFQPLEFSKIALVFYLAYYFSRKQELVRTLSVGMLPPFLVTGLLCILLLTQPDFGGAAFLAGILFFMCLVGGTRLTYLFGAFTFLAWGGWLLILQEPYRYKRWTAFLDPFKEPFGTGYQLVQSFYAFGSGKLTGVGLGAGKQKLFFLPEAHNDFILAVVGEEMGFLGMSLFFLLIGFIIFRCLRIALLQEDLQDRFTAFGMTLILTVGFLLNPAVVLGTVPPKGVPLPFVSYGGSNLIVSFICVGILLNLSQRRHA
ncbi:cell division protein FtsW [Paucidesulfovibrio gracilis DSM 16080]|uniref:Probable peptidoglycan glycosyltransferase FtsW n=1 Tax=Paucidesulfovibrio gracilis DSM 16080 TaxID=1121449 RepID=A0A1T4W5Q4_9BACT|nr:putative lipid II flippase FtsW [Paucidesulfovibrio gracilis]SKA72378.1 cell division protein FtsW [Paucidesulfovibrio gracilis DSM 16080]